MLPNGDGPVHIYLANILWKLAAHASPLDARYYAIRHLLQPYSFHYYLLILLEHAVSPDAAEKLFAGLIWATLACGFRILTRALTPGKPAAALLIFPLLFCWPLSAGFLNFTFAAGLMLFALAFYCRGQLAAWACTLCLLILAHPVPLMILICITGLDLCFQLRRAFPRPQAAAFALACLAFVFPVLIADKAAVAGSAHAFGFHADPAARMFLGLYVTYFQVQSPFGWLVQGSVAALLPFTVWFFLRSRPGSRPLAQVDRLLAATLLFLLATLFFPASMNGSAMFAVRMWFPVWLLLAASLSAYLPPAAQRLAVGLSVTLAGISLLWAFLYLRPVARQQAVLEQAPLPPHARGLFLQPSSGMEGRLTHTWWGLNFWGGVRAFAAHDDVLLNTPWLQLTIVPVRENGRAGLLRDVTPNGWSENPTSLLREITPENRSSVLALADFLLIADPNGSPPRPLSLAAAVLGPKSDRWQCTARDFYAVCTRR